MFIKEINKKTDLNIKFDYDEKTQICTFYKVKKDEIVDWEDATEGLVYSAEERNT